MKCKICDRYFNKVFSIKRHVLGTHKIKINSINLNDYIIFNSIFEVNIYFNKLKSYLCGYDKQLLEIYLNHISQVNMMLLYLKNNIKYNNINNESICRLPNYLNYKLSNKYVTSKKETYIFQYGEDLGIKLFLEYQNFQSKAGVSLDWFQIKYGYELGTIKWLNLKKSQSERAKINSKNDIWISKGSKRYWLKRGYDEIESTQLSLKYNSYSKQYWISKGLTYEQAQNKVLERIWTSDKFINKNNINLQETKNKLVLSIKKSDYYKIHKKYGLKKYWIFKYGYDLGCQRYETFLFKRSLYPKRKVKRQSNIAIKFFDELLTYIPDKENVYYYNHNGEKKIGKYYVDFYYKGIVIEFNGDFWHGNPRFYKEYNYNTVLKKFYSEIWDHDDIKNSNILKIDYIKELFIIWEDRDKTKESLTSLCLDLIKNFKEYNIC
jgi:hypothetical protein